MNHPYAALVVDGSHKRYTFLDFLDVSNLFLWLGNGGQSITSWVYIHQQLLIVSCGYFFHAL